MRSSAGSGSPGRGRRDMAATERVLFALVANRALAPSSKLAAAEWVSHDVRIAGLPATSDDACYRAMDWLHEVSAELEKQVFGEVANLLNLEVGLLLRHHIDLLRAGGTRRPAARDQPACGPPGTGPGRMRRSPGSGPMASPRTRVMTCRRSSSAWP